MKLLRNLLLFEKFIEEYSWVLSILLGSIIIRDVYGEVYL